LLNISLSLSLQLKQNINIFKPIKGRIKSLLDADNNNEKKLNKKLLKDSFSSSPSSSTSSSSMSLNKTNNNQDDQTTTTTTNVEIKTEKEEININDSKINLLLKDQQIDKNKEIAAHLLADLSLNTKLIEQSSPQPVVIQLKPEPTTQINDLLNKSSSSTTSSTSSSSTPIKKVKKNISSLLESPKNKSTTTSNSSKISSLVNPLPPSSSIILNEGETTKIKKQKLKRKSIEESTTTTVSSSKLNSKKRKQQTNDLVDIFGNRLNSIDFLPPGCSNDFEMLDEQQQQHSPSKPSTINSILNKKSIIGPSKPILTSQYKILEEEESSANE
jgi:hypothetical protein